MTSAAEISAMNPWLNRPCTISRVVDESPGVRTYDLVFDDESIAASYTIRPGQFNMIYLPGLGESAISISAVLPDGTLRHTIREAGNVTRALAKLGEGACVGLRGPFGSAWRIDQCDGKDVILVAGGIGLAPLRPVVHQILEERDRFGNVSLLLGARTNDGLLYQDELKTWGDSIHVEQTVDRPVSNWHGHVGVVTALLERLPLPRPQETLLMTCGPEVMMWYTLRTAIDRGISDASIWVSLERNMNCAVGLCGHCQLGPEFICKDGPVFPYNRVASILKVEQL